MRVGVEREFPQSRKKKYGPSSVTSVRNTPVLRTNPLAFPLGGRCHGKAVTDEGRGEAGVSAKSEEEVQALISHQCAHWCQLPPRGKPRVLRVPPPSYGQRPLPCVPPCRARPPGRAVPLAFPLGGRCHGKAVTDEGRGQVVVSATPEQEVHTLISHQCAHW